MKTVFELSRICTNSRARYPLRKTTFTIMGLFSTLAKAENQMHKDVRNTQGLEYKRFQSITEDEESRDFEKRYGHEVILAYKINERGVDTEGWMNIQTSRTYVSNGSLNDECLFDNNCDRDITFA